MPPELEEVKRWLEKSLRDISTVRKLLSGDKPETDIAAFHAQQAVEKLLKAYLVFRRIEFEKIHDLGVLLDQCAGQDGEFASLREDVSPLTAYAVAYRYPGPADPSQADVEQALRVVERVREFVITRIPAEAVP